MNTLMIGVPMERHAQLQALAQQDQKSIADVIADFVAHAIFDGRLNDEVPGWTVQRLGTVVAFEHHDSGFAKRLPPTTASAIADDIERMAQPAGPAKQALLDIDHGLQISRRGTAVKIEDPFTGASRAVARSIAIDLAHLLRKAAA